MSRGRCAGQPHHPGGGLLGRLVGYQRGRELVVRPLCHVAGPEVLRVHALARDRGLPRPHSKGQITVTVNGPDGDLVSTNPKFQAAEAACESLQRAGGTPAQQQQDYAAELKYAQCMQSHGVDVPDPQAPGAGPGTQGNSGSNSGTAGNGVDPNSPQYIAANNACQHYLPSGSGPSLSGGGS
jgi:hypothetical protein